jgi:hypothetical protein
MGGGGVFQKPDVGFGVGVRPTKNMAGMNYGLPTAAEIFRQKEAMMPQSMGQPNVITQTGIELNKGNMNKIYSADDISEGKGRYDRAEARRQEKLDAMAGMAQGQGDRVQAPRPPGQGQPGQFQVKSTPMVDLRRRFPSLEQTEGSLNPFLRRRYNK